MVKVDCIGVDWCTKKNQTLTLIASRFIQIPTAATKPPPIERASKTDYAAYSLTNFDIQSALDHHRMHLLER